VRCMTCVTCAAAATKLDALQELYVWRLMQTDPNFSNFLYDEKSGKIALIDFGATRHFPKAFVDDYLRMVKACADNDRAEIIRCSRSLGFLTGTYLNSKCICSPRLHDLLGLCVTLAPCSPTSVWVDTVALPSQTSHGAFFLCGCAARYLDFFCVLLHVDLKRAGR
jgi:hypothetical protein